MTWQDFSLARQLLVEERIGTRLRQDKALEDAQASKAKKTMPRG